MSTVTILVDHRAPGEAKEALSREGQVVEIESEGIVYPAISGHPDIFFTQWRNRLFHAPNTPASILGKLRSNGVDLVAGEEPLSDTYPGTALYNAVATEHYVIHNFRYSDLSLINRLPGLEPVHVSQGYTRCNLLALGDGAFITSDAGIYRSLTRLGLDVMMTGTESIRLPGMKHGFFGGACGTFHDRVFIMGSLERHPGGDRIREYLQSRGHHITGLYNGPLFDTGGILFIES